MTSNNNKLSVSSSVLRHQNYQPPLIGGGMMGLISIGSYFLMGTGILSTSSGFLAFIFIVFGILRFKRFQSLGGQAERAQMQQAKDTKERFRAIAKVRYLENVGELGEKTADQLKQSQNQFDQFQVALNAKFSQGELTYDRYFGTGAQTFQELITKLEYITQLLRVIDQSSKANHTTREKELNSIEVALSQNQELLANWSHLIHELNNKTADEDLSALMSNIKELADRVKKY